MIPFNREVDTVLEQLAFQVNEILGGGGPELPKTPRKYTGYCGNRQFW